LRSGANVGLGEKPNVIDHEKEKTTARGGKGLSTNTQTTGVYGKSGKRGKPPGGGLTWRRSPKKEKTTNTIQGFRPNVLGVGIGGCVGRRGDLEKKAGIVKPASKVGSKKSKVVKK